MEVACFPGASYRLGEAGFARGGVARHIRDECCGDDWLTAVDARDEAGARISANDLQRSGASQLPLCGPMRKFPRKA